MKTCPWSAFIIAAFISTARADLTIVQEVEGAGSVTHITMKIKGDKTRIEATPQVTSIFDNKSGEMLSILHDQKLVMRTSAAQAKTVAAAITGQLAPAPAAGVADAKMKMTPTGRKETIDGYEAEEYVLETPTYKASYWIAKNYPQGDAILKQLQSMAPQALTGGAMATPDFRAFPGLPLRTNMTIGETKIVSTIKAVKTDPLPESEFAVPQGYKEMKVPDMSGILGRQRGAPKPTPSPKP